MVLFYQPELDLCEYEREAIVQSQVYNDVSIAFNIVRGVNMHNTLEWADIVIVGNGIAGLTTAVEARRFAPDTRIAIITDLRRNFALSIAQDGSATLTEETLPQPDITFTTSSDTLAGILDRTVNPQIALITRKLKVSGKMEDLAKLQKLF